MTYSAVYCALISKRLNNQITKDDCYCETHHIIPKSEGGTNDKDNLVNLTAREHYIAHLLLARIYDDRNMWCAVQMMRNGNKDDRKFRFNSRLYEHARKKRNAIISRSLKGKPHPWQIGRKHSDETRMKQSLSQKGKPRPWQIGRKLSDKARANLEAHRNGNTYVRGKKWWNDGVNERRDFDCPGDGWKQGRVKKNG